MGERKEMIQGKRNVNLDLIRCVAVFCVLSVHIFLYIPFYYELFTGKFMWLLTVIRTSFMVCVPLFALLSGYLCIYRQLNSGYFKKVIPILLTYLLASILSIIVRCSWGETISLKKAIFQILNTNGGSVGYSWYIEMYIGMFLLIPFINAAYHGMETKKRKQVLVLVMLVLTTVPSLLNSHDLTSFSSFFQMGEPEKFTQIFPAWWEFMWPITYYYIGAYIREYDITLPKWKNALFLVAWIILMGSIIYYRRYGSYGQSQEMYATETWGSYIIVGESVLLFLLLLHLDMTNLPIWICKILERISKLSLGIYLCSYITDQYMYYKFLNIASTTRQKQILAPVLMLGSFLLATMASQVIQWIMEIPVMMKKK